MQFKDTTFLHVAIAVGFVAITALCMTGIWFPCFYLATFIYTLYMLLGSLKRGKIDATFFLFPIAAFFVAWIVGFTLAQKYAVLFDNRPPDFTILGFHPSFFWVALLYWIASPVILGIGFIKLRDRWMSPADWEAFKHNMAELNRQEGQS